MFFVTLSSSVFRYRCPKLLIQTKRLTDSAAALARKSAARFQQNTITRVNPIFINVIFQ